MALQHPPPLRQCRTPEPSRPPWLEYPKYSFLPRVNKPGFPATPLATNSANLQPWLETGLFPATRYLNSGHHRTCGCVGIAQDFWWPAPSNRGDKWPWTGLATMHDNSRYRPFRTGGNTRSPLLCSGPTDAMPGVRPGNAALEVWRPLALPLLL